LEGQPQKSLEEGPDFDFEGPEIKAREALLRDAAGQLKEALEVLPQPLREADYRELLARLGRVMPMLYNRYDNYISALLATGAETVSCSRACSHCCSHYVTSVEPYELLFLHGKIRAAASYPNRLIAFHRRASAFREIMRGDTSDLAEDKALYKYYLRDMPCPFLSAQGTCGVYESRPISCRMFFSLSHPSLCKGKATVAPRNRNFIVELPEDIETLLAQAGLLFSELHLPESLFEGLLKVNESFGRFDSDPRPDTP
jgi:Fe-S-cluster containining protein